MMIEEVVDVFDGMLDRWMDALNECDLGQPAWIIVNAIITDGDENGTIPVAKAIDEIECSDVYRALDLSAAVIYENGRDELVAAGLLLDLGERIAATLPPLTPTLEG